MLSLLQQLISFAKTTIRYGFPIIISHFFDSDSLKMFLSDLSSDEQRNKKKMF